MKALSFAIGLSVALAAVAVPAVTAAEPAAAAAATTAAALAYRIPAGDGFALNIAFTAEVPTQGHQEGTASTKARVDQVLADGLRLHVDVASPNALERYALAMGVDLSPEGNASNITGVDMNNDKDAMIAKNVASIGAPSLPNAAVAVGATWDAERPVYLPKAPFPGVPTSIRVQFTYKVQSLGQQAGRDVVFIGVTGKQPASQSVKIALTGQWIVDAATGKPLRAHLEGEAAMRVVFTDMKLPFKVDAVAPALLQFANR